MQNQESKNFSNIDRNFRVNSAKESSWDLIVIGGGITGAGIAMDAATRGIKTLLLEKRDFASGTSSKSTKLIHGGLRYLKQFEIGLVRETGLERAVAHRNIPHLIHPEKMLLPIVKEGEFNLASAYMAIFVYDFLAKVPKKDKKITLSKDNALTHEPLLDAEKLKSAILYSEYRTDDARLTIEIIKASVRHNAEAFNYMKVDDFIYEDGKVVGVQCEDRIENQNVNFFGKHIVNAAGPWVDNLRKENNSLHGKRLHLTKGVHIVVPKDKLPLNSSVYFDAFDGRMIFAIPRGKVTYIGTSDTNYKGDLDRVLCNIEDVEYLLSKVNNMFDNIKLSKTDVISSWAGLRPLIHEDGKSPSELSRKDEIFKSDTGLISIAGGKLTGFRKMSKKIVDLIISRDDSLPKVQCKTKKLKIHEDSFKDYNEFTEYIKQIYDEFQKFGLSQYQSRNLISTYGKTARKIIKRAVSLNEDSFGLSLIKAEIEYSILEESTFMPDDYFNRRSGRLYFDIESVKNNLHFILDEFRSHHKWSEERHQAVIARCHQLINDVSVFTSDTLV